MTAMIDPPAFVLVLRLHPPGREPGYRRGILGLNRRPSPGTTPTVRRRVCWSYSPTGKYTTLLSGGQMREVERQPLLCYTLRRCVNWTLDKAQKPGFW